MSDSPPSVSIRRRRLVRWAVSRVAVALCAVPGAASAASAQLTGSANGLAPTLTSATRLAIQEP